jgi:hypothetical protein
MGYGAQKRSGYTLNLSDVLRLDIQMQASNKRLKCSGDNANSMQNNIPNLGASTSVNSRNISKLPVNGRNFTSLLIFLHLAAVVVSLVSWQHQPTLPLMV